MATIASDKILIKVGLETRAVLSLTVYDATCRELASHAAAAKDINLLAQDSQRFIDFSQFANRFITAPIVLVCGIAWVWVIIGPAVLAGVGLMAMAGPLARFLAVGMQRLSVDKMTAADERVGYVNQVLEGIKVVKAGGWERPVLAEIARLRSVELEKLFRWGVI